MKSIKPFNVIHYNINGRCIEPYDVMPYLVNRYNEVKPKDRPQTAQEFKEFVDRNSHYMFWSRCEYEMVVVQGYPESHRDVEAKWDIYKQIEMNLDVVVAILMENVKKN